MLDLLDSLGHKNPDETLVLGPFGTWVQLTYESLRISEDGATLAVYETGITDGWILDQSVSTDRLPWSDVVVYTKET